MASSSSLQAKGDMMVVDPSPSPLPHHHEQQQQQQPIEPLLLPDNNNPPLQSPANNTAAIEVLHLLGFVLDMWSRHWESLRAMACGGDLREEDKEVVERLRKELRELWEEEGEEMMSKKDEEEEEEVQEEGDHDGPQSSSSSLISEKQGQGDQAVANEMSKNRKGRRSSRKKRRRRSKASHSLSGGAEADSSVEGDANNSEPATMPPAPSLTTIECLPDVVLMRVVDMLGTPPRMNQHRKGSHCRTRATFLPDLTSMVQVCHRWTKVVRSSGVWKAVCERRWPWLTQEDGQELMVPQKNPHHRAIMGGRGGCRGSLPSSSSPWLDMCVRVGRCRGELEWQKSYVVIMEICTPSKLLLSRVGELSCDRLGQGEDEDDDEPGQRWMIEAGGGAFFWRSVYIALRIDENVDVLEALCNTPLSVEVMLMNKRTGKMAMLYTISDVHFQRDEDDEDRIYDSVERKRVLVDRDQCYRFTSQIELEQRDFGENSLTIVGSLRLLVRAPAAATDYDFHSLIKSLEWV